MPVDEKYESQVENLYDSIKDNPGSKLTEIGNNIMSEPWQGLTQAIHDLESKGYVEKRSGNEYYPVQDVDPETATEEVIEGYETEGNYEKKSPEGLRELAQKKIGKIESMLEGEEKNYQKVNEIKSHLEGLEEYFEGLDKANRESIEEDIRDIDALKKYAGEEEKDLDEIEEYVKELQEEVEGEEEDQKPTEPKNKSPVSKIGDGAIGLTQGVLSMGSIMADNMDGNNGYGNMLDRSLKYSGRIKPQ